MQQRQLESAIEMRQAELSIHIVTATSCCRCVLTGSSVWGRKLHRLQSVPTQLQMQLGTACGAFSDIQTPLSVAMQELVRVEYAKRLRIVQQLL